MFDESAALAIFEALEPVLVWFSSIANLGLEGQAVGAVTGILIVVCSAVVGVVFMWWGVRKVVQMIMSAFRSGRISL